MELATFSNYYQNTNSAFHCVQCSKLSIRYCAELNKSSGAAHTLPVCAANQPSLRRFA